MTDDKKCFHLGISKNDLEGATKAIVTGDPKRVKKIADTIGRSKKIGDRREFTSYLTTIEDEKVLIISTGIGGSSTSICVQELATLGVELYLRVGTTGAIQDNINIGDLIIVNGAVRMDGASKDYAPLEYPAVSCHRALHCLEEACILLGEAGHYHVGITASTKTFYPGQERYDTKSGMVPRSLEGSMEELRKLNVLNYEMESATLFTICSTMGLRAGCILGVLATRAKSEHPDIKSHEEIEKRVIRAGIEGMRLMIETKY